MNTHMLDMGNMGTGRGLMVRLNSFTTPRHLMGMPALGLSGMQIGHSVERRHVCILRKRGRLIVDVVEDGQGTGYGNQAVAGHTENEFVKTVRT